jgi:hypothetical protein
LAPLTATLPLSTPVLLFAALAASHWASIMRVCMRKNRADGGGVPRWAHPWCMTG